MDVLQQEVFDFLCDPATHGVSHVDRYDTHAAAVFLAGRLALKVKRAVRFPFLDYSTLAKRKAACLAELEVNRRFAPQLYRRVVPVTREPDGRLALSGDGETVEWALEMVRFDENRTLDRIADRGEFSDDLARRLASTITDLHRRAEPAEAAPWIAAIESYIGQNSAAFHDHPSLFATEQVGELERRMRAALGRLRPLLVGRGEQGLIRRGHGDLHLGNIVLLAGQPVAFDAIEFDPVVASGDVLYDLAFPLMDLVGRGLAGPANLLMNGYFQAASIDAGDRADERFDGLAALPFFMSLRAAIRAKVTAARLGDAAEGKRPAIARDAADYFSLALDLLAPAVPTIVCTGGLSGTGKSVLARALAPHPEPPPGALILRSDVERKILYGVRETDRLPTHAYQPGISAQIYARLESRAVRIVRAGYSVVVDAVFAAPSERVAIENAARDAGARFCGLFLTADLDIRLRRVGGRKADASDADAEVVRRQESYDTGRVTWHTVDASGSVDQTFQSAWQHLQDSGLVGNASRRRNRSGLGEPTRLRQDTV
jgi:aminoglycoside phosphotransferase family enzyme/predicted kinase